MTSLAPLLFDTYYHIYNRGTNGENIFVEEHNYAYFLALYAKNLEPVTDLFAYCLLKNHFHILVRVKSEVEMLPLHKPPNNLIDAMAALSKNFASRQFSNFFNAYAKAINRAYSRTGSLFEHPFGRVAIASERQFWNVIAYIHQNPQKHKFVKDFREWKHSSYAVILSDRRTSVRREHVMQWFGSKEEYVALHREWVDDAQSRWFAGHDFD